MKTFLIKHPVLQTLWLIARSVVSIMPAILFVLFVVGVSALVALTAWYTLTGHIVYTHTPTNRELQATIEAMQAVMTKVAPR